MLGIGLNIFRDVNRSGNPPGYDVLVLVGQSNGFFGTTITGVDIYPSEVYQLGNWIDNDGDVVAAVEPLDQAQDIRTANASGPMRTFVDNYIANVSIPSNRNLLIIANCLSGSGFDDNRWNKGDDLYEETVQRVLDAQALSGTTRVKGIFMQMGERDTSGTDAEWEARSLQFALDFKNDIGSPYSNVPIVVGGMLPSWVLGSQARIDVDTRMKLTDTYIEYSEHASADLPTEITGDIGDGLHYDVVSQRELGNRYWTAFVAAQTNSFVRTVPTAVDDLEATPKASSVMQLNWTKPTEGYPLIESYNIYYKLPASGTWILFENQTALQSSITGLSATTEYDFMVRVVNFQGESSDSNEVTDTTQATDTASTHVFRFQFEQDLDDGAGGTGTDLNSITYTNDGDRGWVYDGNAVATEGVDTGHSITANTSFTKTMWVKVTSNGVQHLMSSGDATGSALAFQSGKGRVGTIANVYALNASSNLPGGWNHYIVTYDAVTDDLELFANNVSVGTATLTDTGTHNIYVGNKVGAAQGFLGLIDDARLYDKVLTGPQRAQVFADDEV